MTYEDESDSKERRTLPSSYKQRRAAGEVALTERHGRLAELMVFGLDSPDDRLSEAAGGAAVKPRGRGHGPGSKAAQCATDFRDAGFQEDAHGEDR